MATSAPVPAVELDLSLAEFRDRILAAFLAEQLAILIERKDAVASLRLTSGEQVVLVTCPPGTAHSALRPTLDDVIARSKARIGHVVAVGGDRKVARELKKSAPFWQLSRQFGLHHVHSSGKVKRVGGKRFGRLSEIVARAATTPAPTEEYLASHLAQGHQMDAEEARLDTALRNRFPWVTVALGAICVVLFVLGRYWSDGSFQIALFRMGANSGAEVKAGEVWRLAAAMFLHANVQHIVVNMFALAGFGPVLERLLGPQRYILLYGLAGLGGGLASALLRDPGISVGASGAIWGLMAAGVGLALWPRGLLPPLRLEQARRRAAAPLAINLLYSFSPRVDLWAHFGGGLVGFGLMATGILTRGADPLWTADSEVRRPRRGSDNLTLVALLFSIVLLGSVVLALVAGRPWQIGAPPVLTPVRVADTGVTMEMPSVIAGPPVEQPQGNLRSFTFGDLAHTPAVVEVVVNVLPQVVPSEQLDEILQVERKAVQEASPPGAQRKQDAKIVTVGGRRFVFVAHVINRITLQTWVSVFRDREVMLRIYSVPDLPTSWAGIENRIVGSLQVR
jgi:rhomboid protease GluP